MKPLTLQKEDRGSMSFSGTFYVDDLPTDKGGKIVVYIAGEAHSFPQTIGNMAAIEQWRDRTASRTHG